jgi:hypothetical protein
MITILETSGILDPEEIRKNMRTWRFNADGTPFDVSQMGEGRNVVTEPVAQLHTGTLTIRAFVKAYLPNPDSARVATLNGPDKWVLQANGSWDAQLQDGDVVGLAPAIGWGWLIYVYYAAMIAMVGYAIYMIATMDMAEGTGTSSIYSLSGMRNEMRYGESVEKQYGYLKRFPPYAAKTYSRYINNEQWVYITLSLGHGRHLRDPEDWIGVENTPLSEFKGVETLYCEPYAPATLFDNNVVSSAEVDGGIELYAPNQSKLEGVGWDSRNDGKYFGWFTVNDVGSYISRILIDLQWKQGLFSKDNKSRWKFDNPSRVEIQYRSVTLSSAGSLIYGTPVTIIKQRNQLASTTPQRVTHEIPVSPGAYQVRLRRLNDLDKFEINDGTGFSETTWSALRGVLPNVRDFGDVTVVMLKAKASSGLTDSSSKRVYTKTTAYTDVYDPETETWVEAPTRNPIWAGCDVMRSTYGGNYPSTMLDLTQLYGWATWCDEHGVTFDYCFDEAISVRSALAMCFRVFRATPVFPLQKLRIVRDEPQLPLDVFTKENILQDSLQIQYRLPTVDDYDGYTAEYTDKTTWETESVVAVLPGYAGTHLKTVSYPGMTDRTQVYRLAMYELSVELENRTQVAFESTNNGWLRLPGDSIYVNPTLFRQSDSARVIAVDGARITLDRNIKLADGENHQAVIRGSTDGSVLGPFSITYADSGDYHTLLCDVAPDLAFVDFTDPQACPIISLGIGSNFAKICRISRVTRRNGSASFETFVDTNLRFAYENSFPDTGIPGDPGDVVPTAPTNVVAAPNATIVITDTFGCVDESSNAIICDPTTGEHVYDLSGVGMASVFDATTGITYILGETSLFKLEDGVISTLTSELTSAVDLTIYDSDNIYISDAGAGCIWLYAISTGALSAVATGITTPTVLCVLGDSLYFSAQVVAAFNDSILKMDLTTYAVTELCRDSTGGLLYNIMGLVTDGTYLYAAPFLDSTEAEITKIDVVAGTATSFTTYAGYPAGVLRYFGTSLYAVHPSDDVINRYDLDGVLLNSQSVSTPGDILITDDVSVIAVYGDTQGIYTYDPTGAASPALLAEYTNPYVLFQCRVPILDKDNLTSIIITWDVLPDFTYYEVQYSTDNETWVLLSSVAEGGSIILADYITGPFYARVAVAYGGYVWAWGVSDETFMPATLHDYVYVTADDYVYVTADDYIYIHQG